MNSSNIMAVLHRYDSARHYIDQSLHVNVYTIYRTKVPYLYGFSYMDKIYIYIYTL
jgi:hypothetical protein